MKEHFIKVILRLSHQMSDRIFKMVAKPDNIVKSDLPWTLSQREINVRLFNVSIPKQ